MKKFFRNILLWVAVKVHTGFIIIAMALRNTEVEVLLANPDNLDESKKKTTRKLHHNALLERFYAGSRDEKYMRDYYEVLKKSDKFMREASAHKMAVAADRHGMNYGQKDKYGKRYEHMGFYTEGHKHAGKTVGEALVEEFEERRTKDDDYELLNIFSNKPTEAQFAKIFDVLEKCGLTYEITVMGTIIEGTLDELFTLARRLHDVVFSRTVKRVVTVIKIDDRRQDL